MYLLYMHFTKKKKKNLSNLEKHKSVKFLFLQILCIYISNLQRELLIGNFDSSRSSSVDIVNSESLSSISCPGTLNRGETLRAMARHFRP